MPHLFLHAELLKQEPVSPEIACCPSPHALFNIGDGIHRHSVQVNHSKRNDCGFKMNGIRSNKVETIIAQLRSQRLCARAELLEFLACNGFQVRDVNCKKRTMWGLGYTYPLHMAAVQDRPRIVSLLLQCGADASKKDSRGRKACETLRGIAIIANATYMPLLYTTLCKFICASLPVCLLMLPVPQHVSLPLS